MPLLVISTTFPSAAEYAGYVAKAKLDCLAGPLLRSQPAAGSHFVQILYPASSGVPL